LPSLQKNNLNHNKNIQAYEKYKQNPKSIYTNNKMIFSTMDNNTLKFRLVKNHSIYGNSKDGKNTKIGGFLPPIAQK
jgi:5-bromo-4-chloroindolyl phosphate hydrolysis protein